MHDSTPTSLMYDRAPVPLMTDYGPPPTMSDMTAAGLQFGPPRASPGTTVAALSTYHSMPTVNADHALLSVNSSQSLAMMSDLHNTVMPLYAVPSVTSVMLTAVHSSYSSSSNAYAHQTPPVAFIIYTP